MSALGHTAETTDDPAYYRAAYREEREKHEALRADLALRVQEWEHYQEEAQQPGPVGVAARRGFVVAAREVRHILEPDPTTIDDDPVVVPTAEGHAALWLCAECGAWVGAQINHTSWHAVLNARFGGSRYE